MFTLTIKQRQSFSCTWEEGSNACGEWVCSKLLHSLRLSSHPILLPSHVLEWDSEKGSQLLSLPTAAALKDN